MNNSIKATLIVVIAIVAISLIAINDIRAELVAAHKMSGGFLVPVKF